MSDIKKDEAQIGHHDPVFDSSYTNAELVEAAVNQGEEETRLGMKKLVKLYYPAALWSMGLSLALVMEGMDVGLVNNFFGQTAYLRKFGTPNGDGTFSIADNWQAAINNGQQIGAVLGLLFNGWAQSRFGSRRVYMFAMVLMAATIFILVFAENVIMLMLGNMACGVPWGIFQTLTTAYAAEICPPAMRGYLTSWVSMCWGSGSFLAAGILRGSLGLPGDWAWRTPYLLQWLWPVPLFCIGYFAPESPWYLVRKERYEEAEVALRRLARPGFYTDLRMRQQLALMKTTNEREKLDAANASYVDCFRGVNLRRTEICCAVFAIQVWCGQPICSYATQFLRASGMAETMAFNYSMAIQSTNIVATGIAIYLMGRIGRRVFYLFGTSAVMCCQILIGIFGVVPMANSSIGVAVAMILINLSFKLSLGPACYTIIGDTPNTRVRAQTIVLARASYIISQIILNQLVPRQLSAKTWNWGAKAGWFWAGTGALCIVYVFFRLPETRNRSFLELDYLFQERVGARQFKRTQVDVARLAEGHNVADEVVNEKLSETRIEVAQQPPVGLTK